MQQFGRWRTNTHTDLSFLGLTSWGGELHYMKDWSLKYYIYFSCDVTVTKFLHFGKYLRFRTQEILISASENDQFLRKWKLLFLLSQNVSESAITERNLQSSIADVFPVLWNSRSVAGIIQKCPSFKQLLLGNRSLWSRPLNSILSSSCCQFSGSSVFTQKQSLNLLYLMLSFMRLFPRDSILYCVVPISLKKQILTTLNDSRSITIWSSRDE